MSVHFIDAVYHAFDAMVQQLAVWTHVEELRMKILITCFDPFGGETINPSGKVVAALPDEWFGLSIVKHAVAYHGGTIRLESKPQEGTTITVEF